MALWSTKAPSVYVSKETASRVGALLHDIPCRCAWDNNLVQPTMLFICGVLQSPSLSMPYLLNLSYFLLEACISRCFKCMECVCVCEERCRAFRRFWDR